MALIPQDKPTQKKLLLVLLPLLALFAYWYFMHGDRTAEIAEMQTHLEELEQKNATARALAARSGPELEERMALYEEYMARLERLIPSQEEVSRLLNDISQRALEVGVNMTLVEPDADSEGRYYTRQTYQMGVVGNFHDIGRFLAEVGSLPRIVTPIDLELTPLAANVRQRTARPTDDLNALFRIETYVLPRPGAVADSADAQGSANGDR